MVCPQLALLYHLKNGKNSESGSLKAVLVKAWNNTKNSAPINVPGWSIMDENELDHLNNDEITMEETEVGRQAIKMAQSSIAGLVQISNGSLQKYIPDDQTKK